MPSEIWRNYVSEILNGGFVWTKRDLSRFHDRGQTIAVPWESWDSQPPVSTTEKKTVELCSLPSLAWDSLQDILSWLVVQISLNMLCMFFV